MTFIKLGGWRSTRPTTMCVNRQTIGERLRRLGHTWRPSIVRSMSSCQLRRLRIRLATECPAQLMSAVLPPSPGPGPADHAEPGAPANGTVKVPLDRVLESIAGFYKSEVVARQISAALSNGHGLSPRQVKLLSPGSARSKRLALMIPRWRKRNEDARWHGFGMLGVAAASSALLSGLVAAVWLAGEFGSPNPDQLLSSLWAVLAMLGALGVVLIATVALMLTRPPTRPGPFDRTVQRQLAAGNWAVVVRGVSWAHQAGVLSLLCSGSHAWCAAWPTTHRL